MSDGATKPMLSKRWTIALLLNSGIIILYCLRVNMSVAADKMAAELNWTEYEKGLVLSSFYWGYALIQIPASIAAEIYGGKLMFGLSVAIPSVLTLCIPMAARTSLLDLMILRCVLGFFEGISFPAVYKFFSNWIPAGEKQLLISAILSGMYLGEIIGSGSAGMLVASPKSTIDLGSGVLMHFGGWDSVFYVIGIIGVLWLPAWLFCAHERPDVCPGITEAELRLFQTAAPAPVSPTNRLLQMIKSEQATTAATSSGQKKSAGSGTRFKDAIKNSSASRVLGRARDKLAGMGNATASRFSATKAKTQYSALHSAESDMDADSSKDVNLDTAASAPSCYDYIDLIEARINGVEPRSTDNADIDDWLASGDDEDFSVKETQRIAQISARTGSTAADSPTTSGANPPWKLFFTHPVTLTLFVNGWVMGWIMFLLNSEMPSYLSEQLGFNSKVSGMLCMLPYLLLFVTTNGSAYLFTWLQHERGWSVSAVRQTSQAIALLGPGIGLVVSGFVQNISMSFIFLIIAQALLGVATSGYYCAFLDASPPYSAILNSISNTIASVAGIAGPIVVGSLTTSFPGAVGWQLSFILTLLQSIVAIVLWRIYQRSEIVPELNAINSSVNAN